MSSPITNTGKIVTIFGGSGFIGRYVVGMLAERGWRIRVAVRRPDLAGHLQPLGKVGQIQAIQTNIRYEWSIDRALEGADAAINLVGILVQSSAQKFDAIQAKGAELIAQSAKKNGIDRLIHLSAIGADLQSASDYARSKAIGENAILENLPQSSILRPSLVFGAEDEFFNRFGAMAALSPILPVIGGQTHFQPVCVSDVAKAVVTCLEEHERGGKIYELGGPHIKTFRELMDMMLEIIGRRRLIVDIPIPIAKLQAVFMELLPKPPFTRDQIKQLTRDNVVSEAAMTNHLTLEGLNIEPTAMDAILPNYLWPYRDKGQFGQAKHSSQQ